MYRLCYLSSETQMAWCKQRGLEKCPGQEVSPTKFENLGGRGSDKKWKSSLQVILDGKPAGSIGLWLQVTLPSPLRGKLANCPTSCPPIVPNLGASGDILWLLSILLASKIHWSWNSAGHLM